MDEDELDALIGLLGGQGVLDLLTPAESRELHDFMEHKTDLLSTAMGMADWYVTKRRKVLELFNRRLDA